MINRDLASPFKGAEMPTAGWKDPLRAHFYYFGASRLLLPVLSLAGSGERIPALDVCEESEAILKYAWSDLVVATVSRLREQTMSYRWQLIRSRLINGS